MAAPALGSWPLRICLALAGSVLSSLQLAVLLARHYPWGGGLERLYAGVRPTVSSMVGYGGCCIRTCSFMRCACKDYEQVPSPTVR